MTTTEKITAGIMAAATLLLLKRNVLSTDGVGGTFSSNKKTDAYLTGIKEQLLSIAETPEESISEIRRYVQNFPSEPDFNLAQYGNMLVYYDDVREFMRQCGYAESTINRMSNDQIWETYLRNVGYVVRELVPGHRSYNRGRMSYVID